MTSKIGFISAFRFEQPSHSSYNIYQLIESVSALPDLTGVVIANGVQLSDEARRKFAAHQWVTLLEKPQNIGVPAAWNLGFDLLDCEYYFIINDDVRIDGRIFNELISVFNDYPETAVVGVEGGICKGVTEEGFPRRRKDYSRPSGFFRKRHIFKVSRFGGFLFAVSSSFVKKTGFRFDMRFSPAFCEELDLAYFARSNGYSVRVNTRCGELYSHMHGVSSHNQEIRYLDKVITTSELTTRNINLFAEKWKHEMKILMRP